LRPSRERFILSARKREPEMREFGEWQDMTGAPRDGTRILVEIKASEQGAAEVDMVRWAKAERAGTEGWVSAESDPGAAIFYAEAELSGWMPLPTPLPRLRPRQRRTAGPDSAEVDGSGI
jgi:hypothetical protein